MAATRFQALPGFRDFTPRDCAIRNYLFGVWRGVARRYGFVEYETPLLEDTELYLKKSGGELSQQLFRFEDQGGRDVCLRPEVTASLARLAAQHQREYPKPLKWFEIGQCFRYEKPQKGRGREFYQFNADILGEPGPGADAELIALAIDTMLALGFTAEDFLIRVSDRQAWVNFAAQRGIADEQLADFLQIIDKWERDDATTLSAKLSAHGVDLEEVEAFIASPEGASEHFQKIMDDLEAREMREFVRLDLSIVRGLAYYTGVVFEVFDVKRSLRAVAGGGRYDTLVSVLSGGAVDLPAAGFAMGDHVIRHFIEETTEPLLRLEQHLRREAAGCDIYLVLADASKRPEALAILADLRRAGLACDMPLAATKMNKQFQHAERAGARFALIIDGGYPELSLRVLASRATEKAHVLGLAEWLVDRLNEPDGPLLA